MQRHISCTLTGVQQWSQRFPNAYNRPKIKAWRCELTALSACHNLYFVACNDTVYIYNPSFPNQSLSCEPVLIIRPPVSSPNLKAGIDPENPHSISRICLDYLGHEEVVLVACDDGDVIGYRVAEIQYALERRSMFANTDSRVTDEDNIKVLFHHNVGASAWGIAVHREARMIAVSANTHDVTVFAFALTSPSQNSDESGSTGNKPLVSNRGLPDSSSIRQKDRIMILHASTNVPTVSFNNNGDDPSGRWLSSSSMDGKTTIWDLYRPQGPARIIQLGFCASVQHTNRAPQMPPGMCHCRKSSAFPHGAWGNIFLDPRSAYGDAIVEKSVPVRIDPCFEDLSAQKAGFSVIHKYDQFPITSAQQGELSEEESSDMALSEIESDGSEEVLSNLATSSAHSSPLESSQDNDDDDASAESTQQFVDNNQETSLGEFSQQSSPDSSTLFIPDIEGQTTTQAAVNTNTAHQSNTPLPWFQPLVQAAVATMYDSDESDTNSEILDMDFGAYVQPSSIARPNPAYCEITTSPLIQNQLDHSSAPCLIITKEDIFLFQRPFGALAYHLNPIMTMRRPLHFSDNRFAYGAQVLPSHDRLCFSTQIPELGIFIVATPDGRAGVFSLTRSKQPDRPSPTYGFQLEYVLPFSKENDREVWCSGSHARLVGVAVGPVQGMFDQSENIAEITGGAGVPPPRRWRLLMHFWDHSVISYELSKMRVSEQPSLGDLVV